jgi:hypothetical protein
MRSRIQVFKGSGVQGRAVSRGDARWQQTMEIVARAFGAIYPHMVAAALDPDCPDVPAAIQTLRERHPQWFVSAAETVRTRAAAATASGGEPVLIRVETVSRYR